MEKEMDSLVNKKTWDLVQLPVGKRALQNKWVYRLKEEDGGKKWYKARLVKMNSIKTILSLVAVKDLHLE
jgi:hypothetical protein